MQQIRQYAKDNLKQISIPMKLMQEHGLKKVCPRMIYDLWVDETTWF
jgi:hypothetical protein